FSDTNFAQIHQSRPNSPYRALESRWKSTILTGWGANCWGRKRSRRTIGNIPKPITDKFEYDNRNTEKPSSVIAQLPHMHAVRSLRSDRARAKLGCYIATELEPKLGRYIATERPFRSRPSVRPAWSLRSDRALPKRRYDTNPCILVYPSTLSPEDRGELSPFAINVSSRKTVLRDLRHDSRPISRFLNQKPVNRRTIYAWFSREDKCQDNYEDRKKWNISIFCYDGLRAEDCDSIRFSRLRVARTRNIADSSRAQAYTL
ncbi:hypothetical protein IGI04_042533, partial [Brassica rapa subsp. trilocularis]